MNRNQDPPTQTQTAFRRRSNERVAGIYVLVEPVGSGAFAEVWKATDTSMNREVALKVFYDDIMARPDLAKGVLKEAESQARIVHERVIAIYACHLDPAKGPGPYYIAMRLMAGGTLDDLLEKERRLPVGKAVAITREIAEGLQAAHDVEIVHRDVKPNNVLFDLRGRVALGDFGIAKDLRTNKQSKSVFSKPGVGTLHYMCPEQHIGKEVTKSWDIYSVGVLLYEMLAGEPPFDGLNDVAVYKAKVETAVPRLEAMVPNLPPRLQLVIDRCLDTDLNNRYPDCDALIRALDWAVQETGTDGDKKKSTNPSPGVATEAALKAGDHVGNFVLEAQLGAGHLAEVWRAKGDTSQIPVAIKVFRQAGHRRAFGAQEHLLDALRKQRALLNDHVVPVYAFELPKSETASRYVVMKMLTGGTLALLIAAKKQLPAEEALKIFRELIDGMRTAHQVGLLHGNLTPNNVLFDTNGQAVLCDFGVSSALVQERMAYPDEMNYVSPERLNGEPASKASDIYSLGLILYEMLTGEWPFAADLTATSGHHDTSKRVSVAQRADTIVAAQLAKLAVPERLGKLIACCLDADLEHRYPDCDALTRALEWATKKTPHKPVAAAATEPAPVAQNASGRTGRIALTIIGILLLISLLIVVIQGAH